MELLAGALIAIVAGTLGYHVRRWEHRREQRLDAYREVVAAYFQAAQTGARLLSVHVQTGFPHKLSSETWSEEAIANMTQIHREAFEEARVARARFDLAAFTVELVGSEDATGVMDDLREFLDGALYSGAPWSPEDALPSANIAPANILQEATAQARPKVTDLSADLWDVWPFTKDRS